MHIDRDAAEFPYEQLAAYFRERIRAGADRPGAKLPSYAAITAETGLSPKTIKRAMRMLESEGLVLIRASRGIFVR